MDTSHYRNLLESKQQELLDRIQRREEEAREDTDRTTPEAMERSVNLEDQDKMLQQADTDFQQLEEIKAALLRIQEGSYGICTACGEQIEPKRLEAVAWTPYCLKDQKQMDRQTGNTGDHLSL